jgi:chromosome segregation ATPase
MTFRDELKMMVSVGSLVFMLSLETFAQNNGASSVPDNQTQQTLLLKELLKEVKALHQAVQFAAVANHRTRISLEQIGQQRAKVESLKAEMDFISTRIQEIVTPASDEDLKELEAELNSTSDPHIRTQILKSYQALKKQQERLQIEMKKEQEMLRERRQVLQLQLQAEQNNLTELQDKLNATEKEIENRLMGKNQD